LEPGQRVRVSSTDRPQGRYEAEVMAVRPDVLSLRTRDHGSSKWTTRDVPVSSITSLEVKYGEKSNVGKGSLIGGGVGAGLGLLLGIAVAAEDSSCPSGSQFCVSIDYGAEAVPLAMLSLGLVGAGIGAIIGALSPGTEWLEVPVEGLRIEPAPLVSGVQVRVPLRL
jgi:hypothetical protein